MGLNKRRHARHRLPPPSPRPPPSTRHPPRRRARPDTLIFKQGSRYLFLITHASPPGKPATLFKRVNGCSSVPHLMLAMGALGRFHAKWWNSAAPVEGASSATALSWAGRPLTAGGLLPTVPISVARAGWAVTIKAGLKALPRCFESMTRSGREVPPFGAEYASFVKAVRPIVRRKRAGLVNALFHPPLTLVHGDAHLENIFFGEQFEGGCTFIDFGLTMFGRALADVAMVVGQGIPVDVRREHERELVRHYYAALLHYGVKDFSWDECWDDFRLQLFRPFLSLLVIVPNFHRNRTARTGMFAAEPSAGDKKLYEMYSEINKRLAAALNDHGWVELVRETIADTATGCITKHWRPCC